MIEIAQGYSRNVAVLAFPCIGSQNKGTFGCCGIATAMGIEPKITFLK